MTKFKALIVDDEPLARLALREYISIASTDFEIAGEAGDGREALSMLQARQDVDLVLADIHMPNMNGVELLEALNNTSYPNQPLTIMLSAYGDYSYVRDSFVHGAFDYMLKAKLDETYIAPVLHKTVDELKKRQNSSKAAADQEDSSASVCAVLHRLSLSDSLETMGEDDEFSSSLELVRTHMGEKNLEVALIRLSDSVQFEDSHRMIMQTIRNVTNRSRSEGICHVCRYDDRHYVLFFAFPEQISLMAVRRQTDVILSEVSMRLKQFINLNLSMGISDIADGVQQWNRLFRQAERLAGLSYYQGYNRLYYPEAERRPTIQPDTWKEQWYLVRTEMLKSLSDADTAKWREVYERCCRLLIERYPSSPDHIKSDLVDMIWEAGALIYQKGLSWEKLHDQLPYPITDHIHKQETWEKTVHWCRLFLDNLHQKLHPKDNAKISTLSSVVAKTKELVEKNFSEDIHLSYISQIVGVSESYLSKQFSKEIGINFIQFLTNLRIEKAKKALEGGMKIYEVSEQVGYVNPEHFSRIFKKVTGVSPLAYRKEME
ncbi:helix-turn-helix domain-containing protein [Paenibacillus sp. GCM10028914]|uniref:response regulator transcription factor n=1 Tax=Paenibacillus sp. GCM10028914 TaxID=3273416 RepID=UPI00361CDB73